MSLIKNFSPRALGITGRQSELLELALTYAFNGIDIDMDDMYRRSLREDGSDATKYLRSAKKAYEVKGKPIHWGMFDTALNLDGDEDSFTASVGAITPIADLAKEIGLKAAYVDVPAASDRLPFNEYFEAQKGRIKQIADVLGPRGIDLGLRLQAGKDLAEAKQYEFIRDAAGMKALVESCPETVGFIVDTWDWAVGGSTLDTIKELPIDRIVSVRMSSFPEGIDPTNASSTDRVLPAIEGPIDHVGLLKHLASKGYERTVTPSASSAQYRGETRESIVKEAQVKIDAIYEAADQPVAPLPMDLIEEVAEDAGTSLV